MKKNLLTVLILSSVVFLFGCSTENKETDLPKDKKNSIEITDNSSSNNEKNNTETKDTGLSIDNKAGIEFVTLEDRGETFSISTAEITNDQYVNYLNSAYKDNKIVYNREKGEVETTDGYSMIQLSGSRVVKDHNKDGVFELDEMENPLNRCYIEYDKESDSFILVDPTKVDWNQYFDSSKYPNVVDSITDWAELNNGEGQFYGNGDTDKLLPTLEEIKKWPVTFIRYYGAREFADYYGYDLPTREEWIFAAKGGQDFGYATNDGNATDSSAWYNSQAPQQIHKGHAQAYDSIEPNPYGIYNLGGNVWEWTKEWAEWTPNERLGTVDRFFIDDEKRNPIIDESIEFSTQNQYKKSLIGGSFNYFDKTMSIDWTHAAYIHAGNDHFGFRVVK
ncbi:formylglycine-generating enzyme family protein [Oceanirhabdus seepicola]|uniref:Formylglycine-generating enzyme family protein n=1 Tax=Oceanirhabdus seepicola TaxID=2828781 RepID=A0A9J6P634_9CLOT|nr:formylglycine-generating enzyme family protein [Oceanirhabdus seepicola]MCM1991716.1 formylglycine-generating enzyme family protein [Oceanirhabdus seepicola]